MRMWRTHLGLVAPASRRRSHVSNGSIATRRSPAEAISCFALQFSRALPLKPIHDLGAVPVKYAVEPVEIFVGRFEVAEAMGHSADIRMNRDRQDLGAFGAFLVKLIESIGEAFRPVWALMLMDHHHRDVVGLDR